MSKVFSQVMLFLVAIFSFLPISLAQNAQAVTVVVKEPVLLEQSAQMGRINWKQGANGTVEAIGIGFPPQNVHNFAQGREFAREAAIQDGYRNLEEVIQELTINSGETLHSFMSRDDKLSKKIDGLIARARISREIPQADGSYRVILSLHLYGPGSLAETVSPVFATGKPLEFPPTYKDEAAASVVEIYTGVVLDARGLPLEPALSPRVYDERGRIVYGNMYLEPGKMIDKGLAGYSLSADMFTAVLDGHSRAGNKPLIIKAIALRDDNCSIVISNADADAMLAGNTAVGFLKDCAVIFVK